MATDTKQPFDLMTWVKDNMLLVALGAGVLIMFGGKKNRKRVRVTASRLSKPLYRKLRGAMKGTAKSMSRPASSRYRTDIPF